MQNIHSQSLAEINSALSLDYTDLKVAIARVASYIIAGKLDEDSSFQIWCALPDYGPANDYNGERSTARRMASKWETEVLTPARLLVGRIRKGREAAREEVSA